MLELSAGESRAPQECRHNEPFFEGHFPRWPLMPRVMIVEALAQATGILCFSSANIRPRTRRRQVEESGAAHATRMLFAGTLLF